MSQEVDGVDGVDGVDSGIVHSVHSVHSPTIAAISTPPGEGGIGIVRLSGSRAIQAVAEIFASSTGRDIRSKGAGRVFHGHVCSTTGEVFDEVLVHEALDEVLVHVMRAPRTYTREDIVEINCHGGAGPLNAVLEEVLSHGCRLAEPGEFTLRAFLNGRIDLIQAEAVIDCIRAGTLASLQAAAAAAKGALSKAIHELRDTLASALAHVEASVDFPDEDLPDLVNESLRVRLEAARERMGQLLETAKTGRLYREGAGVAIAGKPNVGKSSLFNALLRDARAIVSAHPGTTRDRIEETITLNGIPVRLTDTAGVRASNNEIERIGIGVAREALRNADVVLLITDASTPLTEEDRSLAAELEALDKPVWLVVNKADIAPDASPPAFDMTFAGTTILSAKTGQGLGQLEDGLGAHLTGGTVIVPGQGMINRIHQRDSLRRAASSVDRLLGNFDASPEFLGIDLREALAALGEITGETTPEDILDMIFSSFCVGK